MYHCSPGVLANEHMLMLKAGGFELRAIAGEGGLGYVAPTSRTKRVYAAAGEESVPYLRPYDLFDYLPQAADLLSKAGSSGLDRLTPTPGTILQTCSGRNLGPLAYADKFISRFVVSDDMLRLHIEDEADRLYALAFLSTPTGQALLTRSKTGNVIDHLSADDLGAVEVPFIDDATTEAVVKKMQDAIAKREDARIRLDALISDFASTLPKPVRGTQLRDGWTQSATSLAGRLDAAFYDPLVVRLRDAIEAAGGVRVSDVADTSMPDRYKRRYVAAEHGRSILSGRQLLQTKPINLQYIAASSLDFSAYALKEDTIAFGARGRAEDRMSQPALITGDRSEWLASHNLMRVRPKPGVNPGWLYLCFAAWQVQAQVKAGAFGSVVDVVDPSGLDDVLLPPPDEARGDTALQCWRDFATANALEIEAVQRLETTILRKAGARA
jgi:hypothetical protein